MKERRFFSLLEPSDHLRREPNSSPLASGYQYSSSRRHEYLCYRSQDCVKFCLALNSCHSQTRRAAWTNVSTLPSSFNLQICHGRGKDIFLYSKMSRLVLEQTPSPLLRGYRGYFPGVKQEGREDSNSYPSRLRMCGGMTLLPLYDFKT